MPITAKLRKDADELIQSIALKQGLFTHKSRRTALAKLREKVSSAETDEEFLSAVREQHLGIEKQRSYFAFGFFGTSGSSFLRATRTFLYRNPYKVELDPSKLDEEKHKELFLEIVTQIVLAYENFEKLKRKISSRLSVDMFHYQINVEYSVYFRQMDDSTLRCYVVDHDKPNSGASAKVLPITKIWRIFLNTKIMIDECLDNQFIMKIPRSRKPGSGEIDSDNLHQTSDDMETEQHYMRQFIPSDEYHIFYMDKHEDGQSYPKHRSIQPKVGITNLDKLSYDKIPFKNLLTIAYTLTRFIVDMHKAKVIHRDLKPENIQITTDSSAIPIDYAYASDATKTVGFIGYSPPYGAEEAFSGIREEISYPQDIYALSLIIFQLLVAQDRWVFHENCLNHPPKTHKVWNHINNNLIDKKLLNKKRKKYPRLVATLEAGLSINQTERPSAEKLLNELQQISNSLTLQSNSYTSRMMRAFCLR